MSSRWGRQFQISIFGESHGAGIGVVIDGVPAGFTLDLEELYAFLKRRAPGRNRASTPRQESDLPELVSGVQDGRTTGAPLTALIRNSDQHSKDYSELASTARPGHADYTGYLRYAGCNDVRGGGHFSGRLTAPLCFAGGVARQLLAARGVLVGAHAARIAGIDDAPFDPVGLDATTLLAPGKAEIPVLDPESGRRMLDAIELARMEQDSVGGVVECAVLGMPAGVGSPMFDGLENRIASIEFGAGFNAAELRGSQNNDPFRIRDGRVVCSTNHAGGILGGISNGMPILFRAAFKPTPSISQPQQTVDFVRHTERDLTVHGRHDPCVILRAVPVVEAAAAIAAADCLLEADGYRHC